MPNPPMYAPELKARVVREALAIRHECRNTGSSLTNALQALAEDNGVTSGGTIYSWLRALDGGNYTLPPLSDEQALPSDEQVLPSDEPVSSSAGEGESGGSRPAAVPPDNPDEPPLYTPQQDRARVLRDPEGTAKELQRLIEVANDSKMEYFADLARVADYAKTISVDVVREYSES